MTTVQVKETATLLSQVTESGATIDAVHPTRAIPSSGYVVALAGHERTTIPGTIETIERYVRENRAILATLGHYAGIWIEDGFAVLDIVRILPDKWDAIAFGKANKQRAIYDLANNEVLEIIYFDGEN